MGSNAALRPCITDIEIQTFLNFKKEREFYKKKLEEIEDAIKTVEQSFIKIIQNGGKVHSSKILEIKESQRRYPAWKEHFIEFCGKAKADEVIDATEPKIHLSLVIK